MELREKKTGEKYVFRGKILNLRVDDVLTPGGDKAEREIVEHHGGAGIVALDEEGNILLVKQYRAPYDEITLEIPAGKLEKGEDPIVCAGRELSEETGGKAEKIVPLGKVYPSPGYTNEVIHLFMAENVKTGSAHPDDDEYLLLERFSISEALDMIDSGEIKDAKTVIGILRCALMRDKR